LSGVGGYVRHKDRTKGSIVHLRENCEYCGLSYAEIRKGTVRHNMDYDHRWLTVTPTLNFVPFNVSESM
jgi:hypothetical protein